MFCAFPVSIRSFFPSLYWLNKDSKLYIGILPVKSKVTIRALWKFNGLESFSFLIAHFGGEAGEHGDVPGDESIWHARFGHISTKRMRNMKNYVVGLNIKRKSAMDCEDSEICEGCMNGKSSVQPFGSGAYGKVKTQGLFQLAHNNVVGAMRGKSKGGAKYMVTFINDLQDSIHAYFIQTKGEGFSKFKEFKALFENQHGKRIKCLRSNNGGEYINGKFANMCKNSGNIPQTTVSCSPQRNGLAERMNQALTERARCILSHMHVEEIW
uniref:Putative polyprotein n=1 Tax=Albugo laibachii Nc14 TaxID=890382 RepID=F0W6K1_9STRA|nr:putative polyprotein [Albugo laibachii Nc14]|eukprot:CCA16746.1 putative polyprotein [Albugo laibachii Nc14]